MKTKDPVKTVKIVSKTRLPYAAIITIEGKRKVDHSNNSIEVSPRTAFQMVDGVNWVLFDETQKDLLAKMAKKAEEDKFKKQLVSERMEEEDEEEEEEESAAPPSAEEVDATMGDKETAELLKQLPKMSLEKLKETAEEVGLKVEEDDSKQRLMKKISMHLRS